MSAIREVDTLLQLVQQPVAEAIGWALLQFVWQGAVIGALTAITLAVLRRSAADVRYVVATIALSLMLTIPTVTAVQGIRAARPGAAPTAAATAASARGPAPVEHPNAGSVPSAVGRKPAARGVPSEGGVLPPDGGSHAMGKVLPPERGRYATGVEGVAPWL